MFTRIALGLVVALASAAPALAQKKPALGDFPFWSAPKIPHANAFVPGLQAALELTPEQVEKILAARAETVDSPEIRGLKTKGDPTATPDELAQAARKRAEAAAKLHEQVAGILTRDQKAFIEKVNDTYALVIAEVGEEFQPKLIAAKGNAEETAALRKAQREAIAAGFEKKLETILTADQRKAVEKAAEEQKKRKPQTPDDPPKAKPTGAAGDQKKQLYEEYRRAAEALKKADEDARMLKVLEEVRVRNQEQKQKDKPAAEVKKFPVQVFEFRETTAGEMAKVLHELFHDGGRKVRIAVHESTNSLIVMGEDEDLDLIRALIFKIETQAAEMKKKAGKNNFAK